jgi:hypothetical protein
MKFGPLTVTRLREALALLEDHAKRSELRLERLEELVLGLHTEKTRKAPQKSSGEQ